MFNQSFASVGRNKACRFFLFLLLFIAGPLALACTLDRQEDFREGPYKGLKGVCSNSGMEVRCIKRSNQGYSCTGPEGSFQGSDLENLVYSACGCAGR